VTSPLRRTRKITSSHPAIKSTPQRTCVACRQVRAKKELVRLVRTLGGDIEIDVSGKKEGRGAYVCPDRKCWENALTGNQLEHTLKCNITRENREQLVRSGKDLLKEIASA